MNYSNLILTPKNTPESTALKTEVRLTEGLLHGGWIYFPPGSSGLLHCQIFRENIQIAPGNRGASFNMADVLVPFKVALQLDQPPLYITILTWNLSTLYDHSLTVYFELTERQGKAAVATAPTAISKAEQLLQSLR